MGVQGLVSPNMGNPNVSPTMGNPNMVPIGSGGQYMGSPNSAPVSPFGTVTCHICGKNGHYARNCWQAQAVGKQKISEEDSEMKELFRKLMQKEQEKQERKQREAEETKKKEADERREGEKIREEEAGEARLEATILRILAQNRSSVAEVKPACGVDKKTSPRSKARLLREIRSYIAESEDESEEVELEVDKLVEALEGRKKSKKNAVVQSTLRAATSRIVRKSPDTRRGRKKASEPTVIEEGFLTPKKTCLAECSSEGLVEFTLSQSKQLRSLKAGLFDHVMGKKVEISIVITGGKIWIGSRKRVRGKYGETMVIINHKRERLRDAKQDIESGGVLRVINLIATSTGVQRNKRLLRDVLVQPYRIKEIYGMMSKRLVGLYRTAGLFARDATRNTLKSKIARVIKERFGTDVRRRMIVKILFSAQVDMRAVRDLITKTILMSVGDQNEQSLVIERMRLVRLKNRMVASVIHNYRQIIDKGQEVSFCKGISLDRFQGHVRTRHDHVEGVDKFLHNSRNITGGRTISELQILDCIFQATPKGWRRYLLMLDRVDVRRCLNVKSSALTAMTEHEVSAQVLGLRGLVLVPQDRNPGATLVICPVLYLHGFRMTFCWNIGFRRLMMTESRVLTMGKEDYQDPGLTNVATWRTCGRIGRAYVLLKDKDFSRWRPISPSWSEPSRTACARLGRAIRYMMLCLPGSYHFSLKSTDDLKATLTKAVDTLRKTGDMVVARCYDIKDMFAKLPHSDIILFVAWLVSTLEKRGLVAVKVSVRGKACKMARTLRKEDGYVCLTFGVIMKMLRYELGHTYTMCGTFVYQQIFSIPMGKHSFPALANLLCAKAEFDFLTCIGNERRFISGVRMVDDVSVLVSFMAKDVDTYQRAMRLFEDFTEAYPPTLKLVRKDDGNNV
ncbi:hypothetical protein CBR_g4168 [Chara braunii]|uniref:CCHC-type domain-containing protein n=1 Tax=Chara braunii TaxID=69332 RepID=A0A388KHC6_CHABU|nr:hypothetical protein CBR_g4168 [Chara braunii]|eukprot:GBG69474.1 hypothetical protein CBR_g4168 [Chara braunii]